MFGWFKSDPKHALEKRRRQKLQEAHDAMNKRGDRGLHARIMAEVDEIEREIEALEARARVAY